MRGYLAEMFPLPGHLAAAALAALGIAGFTRKLQGASEAMALVPLAGATWNIFAAFLLLRLMDELKDKDIDRQLFPDRPLPSGRVFESDIRLSMGGVMALYVLPNLRALALAGSALVVLLYSLCMFKRFFAPNLLKRSLPITLITHTPIVPLIWLQGFVAVAESSGISPWHLPWRWILSFVTMAWLSVIAWEVSRKIRSREEENGYVTYSQVLGRSGAVTLAWGAQTMVLLMGVHFALHFDLGSLFLLVLTTGWAVCGWAYTRFLLMPNPRTSKLEPYATLFIFAVLLAQAYGFSTSGL
jgi:4-hydroxybenzoate polyprenyltransferase